MKNERYLITLLMAVLITAVLILPACAQQAPATPTESKPSATTPMTTSPSAPAAKPASSPSPTAKPATSPTQSATGGQQYGGTLTILYTSVVPALGTPWEADNTNFYRSAIPALETLLTNDNAERIQPRLAESWKIAPDAKSITFNLRKGVKFQDGTDFNAEAVKFNLTSWPAGSSGKTMLRYVTSVDVVDPYTVRLNLTQYDALLMLRLSQSTVGMMVSPTAAKKATTTATQVLDHMVGTGPFKVTEWVRDDHLKYVKWDGYWQKGKPYLDAIIIQNFADSTTRDIAFKAGGGQYAGPITGTVPNDMKKSGFQVDKSSLVQVGCLMPSGGNPNSPFANKLVREAVCYALDTKAIAEGVGFGWWWADYQFASDDSPNYNPDLKPRLHNLNKAKQLLAEAGYAKGFKTKLIGETRGSNDLLVAIQTYLKEAGIDATLDKQDTVKFTSTYKGGWDGLLISGFPTPINVTGLVSRFGTASDYVSVSRPPGFMDKWDAVCLQTDDGIRASQIQQLVTMIYDDIIAIPVYHSSSMKASNGKVHDISWVDRGNPSYWDPANVWLSK